MTDRVYTTQAEQIAAALGGTLVPHPYHDDRSPHYCILLPGAEKAEAGPALTLRYDPRNRAGQIAVDGWYPRYADGQSAVSTRSYSDLPSINVSHSKTAEQIAKDITRRLLPDYLRLHAKTVERITEQGNREQAQRATRDRLAACFPKCTTAANWRPTDEQNRTLHYYQDGLSADVEVSRDGASVYSFHLRGLTIEQAEAIARLIAG